MAWSALRRRRSSRPRFVWLVTGAALLLGVSASAALLGRHPEPAAAATAPDPLVDRTTARMADLEQALDRLSVEVTQARLDKDPRRAECLLDKHQRLGEVLLAGRRQADELAHATAGERTIARLHAADALRKLDDQATTLQAASQSCITAQLAVAPQ